MILAGKVDDAGWTSKSFIPEAFFATTFGILILKYPFEADVQPVSCLVLIRNIFASRRPTRRSLQRLHQLLEPVVLGQQIPSFSWSVVMMALAALLLPSLCHHWYTAHTHTQTNAFTKKAKKEQLKTQCDMCWSHVTYSLLYCLLADVSRWQTIQTSSCNKSLWYQTWQRK